jgi:hypothetical protein
MIQLVEFRLRRADWDGHIPGWQVPALRLPSEVHELKSDGEVVPTDRYDVDVDLGQVRWRVGDRPRSDLRLLLRGKASHDLSARWKKLAILLPPLVAALTFLLTRLLPSESASAPDAWASLAGSDAYDSFLNGGEMPEKLDGLWEVRLYSVRDDGGKVPYTVVGADGQEIVYPPERVVCRTQGSLVFFSTNFSTGEGTDLWAQGRISENRDVTLLVWPRAGSAAQTLVSVNLLRLERYQINQPIVLSGYRIGVSRNLSDLRTSWIEYKKVPR